MKNNTPKILVVDDLPDWRTTIGGLLRDEGYEVQVAESRPAALALLRNKDDFALAVLDLRLDETDEENVEGLDLAAEIRQHWPDIKIIILTGYSTPERQERALQPDSQGQILVEEFIEKTETEELVQKIRMLLT